MSGMNRARYLLQKYPKIMVIGTRLGYLWMNIRNGASHTNLCGDGYFCSFVKHHGQIWSFPYYLISGFYWFLQWLRFYNMQTNLNFQFVRDTLSFFFSVKRLKNPEAA